MNHIDDTHATRSQAPWLTALATRTGRMHRQAGRPNEDCAQVRSHAAGGLSAALADGVGSGRRGDLASAAVVQHWVDAPVLPNPANALSAAQALLRGSEAALHRALPPALGASGSMAVVAWTWNDGQVLIGHVGDCRAYLWRAGLLQPLTRDHTYANLGLKPPAWRQPEHPARMVGGGKMGPADMQRLQLRPGDVLMLCSDGVHGPLDEAQLAAIWAAWEAWAMLKPTDAEACAAQRSLRALALRLVRQARLAGGRDDISVLLAAFKPTAAAAGAAPQAPGAGARPAAPEPLAFAESVWPQDMLDDHRPPAAGPTFS